MQWYVRKGYAEAYETDDAMDPPILRRALVSPDDDALPTYEHFLRETLMRRATMMRRDREAAGIDTPYGRLSTDRESQAVLAAAVQFIGLKSAETVMPWKLASGTFISLTGNALRDIAERVGDHVTWCFERERCIADALTNAVSEEELLGVDMSFT